MHSKDTDKVKHVGSKKDTSPHKEDRKVEALTAKVEELENNWKRALADYINLQKRTTEEKIETVRFANQSLLIKLLGILDSLEMVEQYMEDEGLKLILKEFRQILKNEGIEEIETLGKNFDFTTMEAVEMVPGENGQVISVITKGYTLRNRLLRSARVQVGNGQPKEELQEDGKMADVSN